MDPYIAIGKILKEAREGRKLSQAAVGRKVGLTGQAISLIEVGKTKANIERLQAIGRVVGVEAALIVAGPTDKRGQLVARIANSIDYADDAVVEALEAWVAMWEAKKDDVGQRATPV